MRLLRMIEERLRVKLNERVLRGDPDQCWEWQGGVSDTGYGMVTIAVPAHRLAYWLEHGEIADNLQVDHTCRNRRCCNPLHLEAVTQRENILRGISPAALHAKKTHCKNNHPFTPENTHIRKDNGGRQCKTCHNESSARSKRRNRAAS